MMMTRRQKAFISKNHAQAQGVRTINTLFLLNILKFADDTNIFGKVDTAFDFLKLQKDLQTLIKWSVEWQMEFNGIHVKKWKAMHIGMKNIDYEYSMNGVLVLFWKVLELKRILGS